MNRQQKSDLVTNLKNNLTASSFVTIVHYRGMSDKQLFNLRSNLKSKGCNIKIAKNTLIKIAISGTNLEPLSQFLEGPTAILYSNDPVALAKAVCDSAKQVQTLEIKTGFFNNGLVSQSAITEMAKLGSLEEVRASFIGMLKGAQSKFVRVLQAPKDGLATLKTE
jgi:large subunit ribosomal protein L10